MACSSYTCVPVYLADHHKQLKQGSASAPRSCCAGRLTFLPLSMRCVCSSKSVSLRPDEEVPHVPVRAAGDVMGHSIATAPRSKEHDSRSSEVEQTLW